uniref:Uncharacterized protein n=1 Tax=Pithovirus LCPAC302 TaxID=2506593 RepID=A0A481Z6Z0_9VIRU|nr:MAG: hypothetical protein LCPAC302_00060 [Pithovirus LCPAC302]
MYAVILENTFSGEVVCRFFDDIQQATAYSQRLTYSKIIEIRNGEEITIKADNKGYIELLTNTEKKEECCIL